MTKTKFIFIFLVLIFLAIVGLHSMRGDAPTISFEIAQSKNFHALTHAKSHEKIKNIPAIWNEEGEIFIVLSDKIGIKNYQISLYENEKLIYKKEDVLLDKLKKVRIALPKPDLPNGAENKKIKYEISVRNWSNANLFFGKKNRLKFEIEIDKKAPEITPLTHSPKITRGGAALVFFKAKDSNLKDVLLSNGVDEFLAFKYAYDAREDAYFYGAMVAWPLKNNIFNLRLIGIDFAGNKTEKEVLIPKQINISQRKSNITLKPSFLDGKLLELLAQIESKNFGENSQNQIAKFKFLNEKIRDADNKKIFDALGKIATNKNFINENFAPFLPMKNAKIAGHFGDARTYIFEREKISKSTHLGIDLASVKKAPIIASNEGAVLLKERLGIYGNTILLYHGFGMASEYSHLSSFGVNLGDVVEVGSEIAKSGSTGWSFGDHLHFGVLIQGHAVSVNEWMNSEFITTNITQVLKEANAYFRENDIKILD